jgi:hypothetical protein
MERVPCTIRLLKVSTSVPGWYEILEYKRLVEAAQTIDARIHIMVLLAGSAGSCSSAALVGGTHARAASRSVSESSRREARLQKEGGSSTSKKRTVLHSSCVTRRRA